MDDRFERAARRLEVQHERAALTAELIRWELEQARVYGEPMTREMATEKVNAGLARIAA